MLTKTSLLVLHRFPYSDSSLILKVLTPEYGILSVLVKGAKRKENVFKNALDPFAESEVVLNRTNRSEFCFFKETTLKEWFPALRENLVSNAMAQVMAEILLCFAPHGLPLLKEYALLRRMLYDLNAAALDTKQAQAMLSRFLFSLCEIWGFDFNMRRCGGCGNILQKPPTDFKEESGEVFCESCSYKLAAGRRADYLNDLFIISRGGVPLFPELAETGLLHYLKNHLGMQSKELQTISWLKEVRKICAVH